MNYTESKIQDKKTSFRRTYFQSPYFSEEECQGSKRWHIYFKQNCYLVVKLKTRILVSQIPQVPGSFMVWLLLTEMRVLRIYPPCKQVGTAEQDLCDFSGPITPYPCPSTHRAFLGCEEQKTLSFQLFGKKLSFGLFIWKPALMSSRVCYKEEQS